MTILLPPGSFEEETMLSRRRCLVSGILCLVVAAGLFGWLIEPMIDDALIRHYDLQGSRQDGTGMASGRELISQ